jgi:hypothetical protein
LLPGLACLPAEKGRGDKTPHCRIAKCMPGIDLKRENGGRVLRRPCAPPGISRDDPMRLDDQAAKQADTNSRAVCKTLRWNNLQEPMAGKGKPLPLAPLLLACQVAFFCKHCRGVQLLANRLQQDSSALERCCSEIEQLPAGSHRNGRFRQSRL